MPDDDDPGRKYIEVVHSLISKPASVKIALVPNPNEVKGYDIADHVATAPRDFKLEDLESNQYLPPLSEQVERTKSTDDGTTQFDIADGFAKTLDGKYLFDAERGSWHRFDGVRWENSAIIGGSIRNDAKKYIENNVEPTKFHNISQVNSVVETVGNMPAFARLHKDFDSHHSLLATAGGVLNLANGGWVQSTRGLLLTKSANIKMVEEESELWQQLLLDITKEYPNEDAEELREFLQVWFGYNATGWANEHICMIFDGPGGNGKSTLVNAVLYTLGEYDGIVPTGLFTGKGDNHPTKLAKMSGLRMAVSHEPTGAWRSDVLKSNASGDPQTARWMRANYVDFDPTGKFNFTVNGAPKLHQVDEGIRRRLKLVKILFKPKKENKQLAQQLQDEEPKILYWLTRGAMKWHRSGLWIPAVIEDASNQYLDSEDTVELWVQECCEIEANIKTPFAELWKSYREFAKDEGRYSGTRQSFGSSLTNKGFIPTRVTGGKRCRKEIRLKRVASTLQQYENERDFDVEEESFSQAFDVKKRLSDAVTKEVLT